MEFRHVGPLLQRGATWFLDRGWPVRLLHPGGERVVSAPVDFLPAVMLLAFAYFIKRDTDEMVRAHEAHKRERRVQELGDALARSGWNSTAESGMTLVVFGSPQAWPSIEFGEGA